MTLSPSKGGVHPVRRDGRYNSDDLPPGDQISEREDFDSCARNAGTGGNSLRQKTLALAWSGLVACWIGSGKSDRPGVGSNVPPFAHSCAGR